MKSSLPVRFCALFLLPASPFRVYAVGSGHGDATKLPLCEQCSADVLQQLHVLPSGFHRVDAGGVHAGVAEEALALAKQFGISERTLKIAKRNLGILSERRADQWLWRLPEQEGKGVTP